MLAIVSDVDKPYIEFSLAIKYTNPKGIPIPEIAESLLALENIVKFYPNLLNNVLKHKKIKGLKFDYVSVKLQKLESGSLIEDIIVRLFFKDKENLNRFLDKIRNKYHLEIMSEKAFAAIFLLILASWLLNSCANQPESAVSINITNSGYLNVSSNALGVSNDELLSLMQKSIHETKSRQKIKIGNSAIKFLGPIKRSAGNIIVDQDDNLSVFGSDIESLPKTAKELPTTITRTYENVSIYVRALDRDDPKKGWSIIVPDVSNKRVKVIINPQINLNELASREAFIGTVIAEFDKKENKEVLRNYILRSIR